MMNLYDGTTYDFRVRKLCTRYFLAGDWHKPSQWAGFPTVKNTPPEAVYTFPPASGTTEKPSNNVLVMHHREAVEQRAITFPPASGTTEK